MGETSLLVGESRVRRWTPIHLCARRLMSALCFIAVLAASQSAVASIVYALALSGDLTGSGAVVFEDGAFDVDGVHDLADVLESFELTVDAMPAKGELRATPPVTFTTDSIVTPEKLQYEVRLGVLAGLDLFCGAIIGTSIGEAIGKSANDEDDMAQRFEDGAFSYSINSASLPFFRCDPRVEDCHGTLTATAVPEPSSAVLLFVMASLAAAFASCRAWRFSRLRVARSKVGSDKGHLRTTRSS
jgi:hypothetical protein